MRVIALLITVSCRSSPACEPAPAWMWPQKGVCQQVADDLEFVRRGYHGDCRLHLAEESLVSRGRETIPYLIRAFEDGNLDVAETAMRASMRLGADEPVRASCRGARGKRRVTCDRALAVPKLTRRLNTLDCAAAVRY
jgi:hypothetical protein